MTILLAIHIAAGCFAILAGAAAIAARKGGRLHARTGSAFFGAMLVLGVTASMLEPYRTPPGSPLSGIFVVYFVATSWVTARRRDGRTGWFEMLACAVALGLAALLLWSGLTGATRTPAGSGPVFILAGLCAIAGLLDLNAVLRRRLTPVQRISRHLWRMCFGFFIATGSFFLGQQQVLPAFVRDTPLQFILAFAPFAATAFWLVRVRFGRKLRSALEALGERRSSSPSRLVAGAAE